MVLAFSLLFMAYGAVMTPVEHYDRQHYPNIFFFFDQDRVNSLADCTIDAVGAGEFLGKKQVYIYYNYYEMSDFYAEYFYKPFDPEKTGQGTEIEWISFGKTCISFCPCGAAPGRRPGLPQKMDAVYTS